MNNNSEIEMTKVDVGNEKKGGNEHCGKSGRVLVLLRGCGDSDNWKQEERNWVGWGDCSCVGH